MIDHPLQDLRLILCSASPRRRELLQGLGLPVEITSVDVDETPPADADPAMVAEILAKRKAEAWSGELAPDQVLITADTIVLLGDKILGKPKDATEANKMLRSLSGHSHQVITGVCLKSTDNLNSFSDVSDVTFKELTDAEIAYYIEHFKPFDKAGGYGIQEWIGYIGVTRLEGSYYNVMGLPLERVWTELLG